MKTQIKALLLSPIVADILKRKSTEKQDVRTLQHILFELGFGRELDWKKFGADGVYGTGTSAAVKAFAAKNGIDTDGESATPSIGATIVLRFDTLPDLRELKKIFDKNQTSTVLTRGSRHKGSIQSLQRLLHALGFGEFMNWEQFGADGIYGNGTAAAVRAFAEKENIPTDGNRMDWELAARMLNRFTPFLGTDWNAPETTMPLMPVQPRGPKSQYRSLFPVVNRNTDEVQRILDPHYEFQKLAHEIPGDDFALEHLLVTKKNRDASY